MSDTYSKHLEARGFVLENQIGFGLSGTVWRGTQRSLGRHVAIKFGDGQELIKNTALRKRFEREGRLLAKVQHPGVPYVITTGTVPSEDVPYTIMEYVQGQRLRDALVPDRGLEHSLSVSLTLDLLDALEVVHEVEIVHRDICPENILVRRGRAVLIDFSIGVALGAESGLTRATQTGDRMGRADYASPEHLQDMGQVDSRSDVYSTAIVLLEMLVGSPKFALAQFDAQLGHLNDGIRSVLKKALAQDRDARFRSSKDFAAALRPFSGGPVMLNRSVTAICANLKCPQAQWSPRGYYRGPAMYADSVDAYCGACGSQLRRQCASCADIFKDKQFCGNCGMSWYDVPTCLTCSSLLKAEDMGTNTTENCCSKGRGKRPRSSLPSFGNDDDDLPF